MWPQAHSPSLQGSRSSSSPCGRCTCRLLRCRSCQWTGALGVPREESWGLKSRGSEQADPLVWWGVHTRFILARTLMSQRHRRPESHCSVVCFKASVLPTLHTERAMSWICHNLVLKKRERLFCWKLPPWPKLAYEPPKKISFRIFVWIFACSNDKLPQTQ